MGQVMLNWGYFYKFTELTAGLRDWNSGSEQVNKRRKSLSTSSSPTSPVGLGSILLAYRIRSSISSTCPHSSTSTRIRHNLLYWGWRRSSRVGQTAWKAREAEPIERGERSRRRVVSIGMRDGRCAWSNLDWAIHSDPHLTQGKQELTHSTSE